jgi:hypothetical protein
MVFQYRMTASLEKPLENPPIQIDPRSTLKQNVIKPKKDFNIFRNPTATSTRSLNMFQTGMIANVNGPINGCSSCGGAK